MRAPDWIELVEASYALDGVPRDRRRRVLEAAIPLFGGEEMVVLFEASVSVSNVEIQACEVPNGRPETEALAIAVNDIAPPEVTDLVYRSGAVVGSLSEQVFPKVPAAASLYCESTGNSYRDQVFAVARPAADSVVLMVSPRRSFQSTSVRERRRWGLAMAHVGTGLRLQRALAAAAQDRAEPEAVLDSSGALHHAVGPAQGEDARGLLREAVRQVERARSRCGRSDPDAAMESWKGLVGGRWSLVDRFDRDGRRFVVAHKNEPGVTDPRGLSPREYQIAERIGLGRSTKEIAYELGLSLSAVSMGVKSANRKLGLASRVELASFFSPGGIRARLLEMDLHGKRWLVGAHPLLSDGDLSTLSPAEREVATALVAGSTSAEVAKRRGTSARTVANQIASIFMKLGVNSRVELAARLSSSVDENPTA